METQGAYDTKSVGEQRIRKEYRPLTIEESEIVAEIKQKAIDFIDFVEKFKSKDPRLVAMAQTSIEQASWAATSAITK